MVPVDAGGVALVARACTCCCCRCVHLDSGARVPLGCHACVLNAFLRGQHGCASCSHGWLCFCAVGALLLLALGSQIAAGLARIQEAL
eukprot:14552393-Alexandrium_andersonii.AAC.1